MSEQPTSTYNPNNYRPPVTDGSVEMDDSTNVWLKASEKPLVSAIPERSRELTEAEKLANEIRMAASKLQSLNDERRDRLAA